MNRAQSMPALRALALALLAVASLATGACQSPRTQVIVAVDADPTILALVDGFRIEVTGPDGRLQSATSMLSDGQPLPRTLGLAWTSGPLGPYTAVVSGMLGTSAVTSRRAVFEFVRGQTLVLHVTLVGRCITTSCSTGQTCGENGCRSEIIAPSELEPYGGSIARRDGGVGPIDAAPGPDAPGPDAFIPPIDAFMPPIDAFMPPVDAFVPPVDAFTPSDVFTPSDAFTPDDAWLPDGCMPMPETCNELDDDCDLMVDDGFDLMTDEMNCGMCGNVCGAGRRCCRGMCQPGAC